MRVLLLRLRWQRKWKWQQRPSRPIERASSQHQLPSSSSSSSLCGSSSWTLSFSGAGHLFCRESNQLFRSRGHRQEYYYYSKNDFTTNITCRAMSCHVVTMTVTIIIINDTLIVSLTNFIYSVHSQSSRHLHSFLFLSKNDSFCFDRMPLVTYLSIFFPLAEVEQNEHR